MKRCLGPLLGALALAGCASSTGGTGSTATPEPNAAGAATVNIPPLVATLTPMNSRLTGTVRLVAADRPGQVRARISLRNANIGAEHPWVIRRGLCGEAGTEILGPQAAYQTVRARGDGSGDLTVTLPIAMPEGPHSVYVLLSTADRERVIACGNLSAATS